MRKRTRKVRVGDIYIGGDAPISVQGMTKCRTADVKCLLPEAKRMIRNGAEMIRVAVLDGTDIGGLKELKKNISVPVVADIHYHKKLALLAMEGGVDKI
ncbi:MAG: flavodoxin-dependent (E)-4-hydroxy-3-methylbut-2-enyl-diphosphate synthase, partial [Candidatus Ratteibacteria bacterium]|nr:flavodoxin-dependent (E)-4-hydroxy-3-methylbut-2-enyl-diphosphate synthase [Candidatus Ratteibacteria bacterium]